jgi:hypothetical protein
MSNILIRDLDPDLVERLKAQAKRNDRSLQAELRVILEREARRPLTKADVEGFLKRADEIRKRAGPQHTNSTEILRRLRNSDLRDE